MTNTDLVKRLLDEDVLPYLSPEQVIDLCSEAAAAIIGLGSANKALTAERDRLREALEKIAGEQNVYKGHGNYDTEPACSAEDAQKIARDELSKKCSTLRT